MKKLAEGLEAEIFAWEDGRVLRLMRDHRAVESNRRQATAMEAARASGVRVPRVHDVITVADRPGIVMERVDGRDLMAELGRRPWRMFWVARVSGEIHTQLHRLTAPASLPDLREKLRQEIGLSRTVPGEVKTRALVQLANLPPGERLCHGDFYPANLLLHRDGPVLIDWARAARGDPAADVARTLVMVILGELPAGTPMVVRSIALWGRGTLAAAYLRAYRCERTIDPELVTRWEYPVAAARLAEGIEGERLRLLKFLCRPARVEGAPQIM